MSASHSTLVNINSVEQLRDHLYWQWGWSFLYDTREYSLCICSNILFDKQHWIFLLDLISVSIFIIIDINAILYYLFLSSFSSCLACDNDEHYELW